MGRLRRLSGEVARFFVVNVVATTVALVIFNGLTHGVKGWFDGPMHEHPITTYLIANTVGMIVSYVGSRSYAFRHRHANGPGGGVFGYAAINFASFVIPISLLWVSRNVLDQDSAFADNISANVLGTIFGATFRFWAFRTFVFTSDQNASPFRRLLGLDGRHLAVPELGPDEAQLVEHQPEQGDAEADDVVGVARHAGDKGATPPIDGEGPRHSKGLAGGDVGLDLLVTDVGETDLGRG
jgi:putative flippase GtrA